MNFSYNWLRELVPGLRFEPAKLSQEITMKTAECEGVLPAGELLEKASIAEVMSAEPLSGSSLVRALVRTEKYGEKTVVCGAPNCRKGVRTLYLPAPPKTIHGVESNGLLASGAELGINGDAAGIVILEHPPGQTGPQLLTSDAIIEINNKSLTNRPDLWGHFGMAREVAAISGLSATDPVRKPAAITSPERTIVDITDADLCARYSVALIEGVQILPSPLWLQYRLHALGHSSINNIVDITNYVMMELGQPTHAFDADLLGGTVRVRRAAPGEQVKALNGETYTFTPDDILIANPERGVGVAGIIGGADTAIGDATTRILFESASFPAAAIRKTSSRIKLRTDASMRFEKGQDPENTMRAISRILELVQQIAPGARVVSVADTYVRKLQCPRLILDLNWAERKLGRPLPTDVVVALFQSLLFQVEVIDEMEEMEQQGATKSRRLAVGVPSWRATKDISIPEDLVEEIGRMLGYASIVPQPPAVFTTPPQINAQHEQARTARTLFTSQGFTEVHNYSFIPDAAIPVFGYDPALLLQMANPMVSDQNYLRPSLLPGIWKNVVENSRYFQEGRLVELGRQYNKSSDAVLNDAAANEPAKDALASTIVVERTHLAAAIFGRETDGANLLELKRVAQFLRPDLAVLPSRESRGYEHPERTVIVKVGDTVVGRLFELHPALLDRGRAAMLDIDLDLLLELPFPEKRYQSLSRFPTSSFDLSLIADVSELVSTMEARLREFGAKDLVSLQFLVVFPLPEGKKSVSFRFTVGAKDHTLTSEGVAGIRDRILRGIKSSGYEFRE